MWLVLVKRFWPLIAGAVVLLGVYLWHLSAVSSARHEGYAKAQSEFAAQLERERELRRVIDEETRREYEQALDKVRADAARELRGRSIHCVLGPADPVRAGRDPSAVPSGTADQYALRADVDLRPQIVRVGETCEQLRQQLIAIKARQDARLSR